MGVRDEITGFGITVPESLSDDQLNEYLSKVGGTPDLTNELIRDNFQYDLNKNAGNFLDDLDDGWNLTAISDVNRISQQEITPLLEERGWEDPGYVNEFSTPEEIDSYTEIASKNPSTAKAWFDYIVMGERVGGVEDWSDKKEELLSDLPIGDHRHTVASAPNYDAAVRAKTRIMADLAREQRMAARNGFSSGAANLIGGIVDVDLPLALFTGGGYKAATVAARAVNLSRKAGLGLKTSHRLSSLAVGMNAGLQSGAAVGTVQAALRDSEGWSLAVESALATAVLGGGLNTVLKGDTGLFLKGVQNELYENLATGANKPFTTKDLKDIVDTDVSMVTHVDNYITQTSEFDAAGVVDSAFGDSSVGAAQVPKTVYPEFDLSTATVPVSDRVTAVTRQSEDFLNGSDWVAKKNEDTKSWLYKWLADPTVGEFKLNLGAMDFNDLLNSNAPTAQRIAATVFESPHGIGRGRVTAGIYRDMYTNKILAPTKDVNHDFLSWMQGRQNPNVLSSSARQEFNTDVIIAMNDIRLGKAVLDDITDPSVKNAVSKYIAAGRTAADVYRGNKGQLAVRGSEVVDFVDGYVPRVWNGAKLNRLISSGELNRVDVEKSLASEFKVALDIPDSMANSMSRAYISRALNKANDVDMSLSNLLTHDGRDHLEKVLRDTGVDDAEVRGIMDHLTSKVENRSLDKNLKSRTDFDISAKIGDTEFRFVDLMDTDLDNLFSRYARGVGGSGALARVGITSRADRDAVIDAIVAEQSALKASGKLGDRERLIPREKLEAMFSEFDAGPRKGYAFGRQNDGVGKGVAIAKSMTSASMLGSMVFAQLGETGTIIATRGIADFFDKEVSAAWSKAIRDTNGKILDDLAWLQGDIGIDERTLRLYSNLDEAHDVGSMPWLDKLEKVSVSANKWQNKITGYDRVFSWQQQMAQRSSADKILRYIDNWSDTYDKAKSRFDDTGLDFSDMQRIHELIENGTVEMAEYTNSVTGKTNRYVVAYNLHEWPTDLADVFTVALRRKSGQLVQTINPGESSSFMHSVEGSILFQFQSFVMTAYNKQFVRNIRHSDTETLQLALMGFTTAFMAVTVKDALRGKERSAVDRATMALTYSNMTGWYQGPHNTLMGMLGLEDYRLNGYGPTNDMKPPVLTTINRAMRLPGAAVDKALGTDNYYDDDALRVLPFSNTIYLNNMLTRD